jgi:hypothetical protein
MALTLIEQARLYVGDFGDPQILTDEDYQFFLDKYEGSVRRAAIDAAVAILFYLTRWPTRERTDSIEVWNEWANAYRKALETFIKDPNFSVPNAIAYAGGTSKSDMLANDANNDNVRPQIYQGMSDGVRVYNSDNCTDDDQRYYW